MDLRDRLTGGRGISDARSLLQGRRGGGRDMMMFEEEFLEDNIGNDLRARLSTQRTHFAYVNPSAIGFEDEHDMEMDDVDGGNMLDARVFLAQKRARTTTARRDAVALKRLGREPVAGAGVMKNFKVVASGNTKNEGAETLLKELRVVKQLHASSMGIPAKRTVATTSTSAVAKTAPTSIIRRAVRTVQNTKANEPASQPVLTSTTTSTKKTTASSLKDRLKKPTPVTLLITSLADTVTEDDVKELCATSTGYVSAKMVDKGIAHAVFKNLEAAQKFASEYDGRAFDDKEMKIHLLSEDKSDDKVTAAADTSTAPDDNDMSLLAQRRRTATGAEKAPLVLDKDVVNAGLHGAATADADVEFVVKV